MDWLGFEKIDCEAIIDLGELKKIQQVIAGCLQDQRTWIFLPTEMVVAVSDDGDKYTQVGAISLNKSKTTESENQEIDYSLPGAHDLRIKFDPVQTQYVKVILKSTGVCPAGHPGAGGKAWLFVDEIIVE